MAGRKTIFIVPGFRQKPTSKAYREIAKILKRQGYYPILCDIPWKNSTISQNSEYFLKLYKKVKTRKKYILGFSYGAMIAFIASTKISVSGLVLCSLSPYFNEDISNKKQKDFSSLTKARFRDFSKLNSQKIAKKTKAKKILMLYGTQEARSLIRRVTQTFGEIESPEKHLVRIRKTEHEIGNQNYLKTITQAIFFL